MKSINSSKVPWVKWMRRAIDLASLAEGSTSPNPLVGAIVLDASGRLVGEGFHSQSGHPHAEVEALNQAGDLAKGGTLVVNLEPCCHYGRTPPCTEAIIKSEISRVVIALEDPDPRVSGKGISFLENAGIEIIKGVLEKEASYQNRSFIFRVRNGRPWGTLKWAMTLDGRIALPNGSSKWISGNESRVKVHGIRAKFDAIIVGGSTVRNDNPLLTSRGIANKEALRVVFTASLNLPKKAKLWDTDVAETLIAYGPNAEKKVLSDLPVGPTSIQLNSNNPIELMNFLAKEGCNNVLWECGGNLAKSAIESKCVQELIVYISPKLIGGHAAMTPLADFGFNNLDQAINLKHIASYKEGNDLSLNMLVLD